MREAVYVDEITLCIYTYLFSLSNKKKMLTGNVVSSQIYLKSSHFFIEPSFAPPTAM